VRLLKLFLLMLAMLLPVSRTGAQGKPIVIAASTILDGKGDVLHNTRIVIEGGKISRIDPEAEPVTYDLRGLTILPGFIDAHVHLTYHFGPNGHFQDPKETRAQAELAVASNAWVTLMNGFTTVQSVGSSADIDVREATAKGTIPGPRLPAARSLAEARKPTRRTKSGISSGRRRSRART